MESVVNWRIGTPTEKGHYITTREIKRSGKRYVRLNIWRDDKWQMNILDGSIVVAWCPVSEIEPYKE